MIDGGNVGLALSKLHPAGLLVHHAVLYYGILLAGLFLHHAGLYYGILLVPKGGSSVGAIGAQAPLPAGALWS